MSDASGPLPPSGGPGPDAEPDRELEGRLFRVVLGFKQKAGAWVAMVLDSVTRSRTRQRDERHERRHATRREHQRYDADVSRWEDEGGAL